MVSVFAFGTGFLTFCPRTCICYGFLFEVFPQWYFESMATCGPKCELRIGVVGIVVGLVVVFYCVCILSRL